MVTLDHNRHQDTTRVTIILQLLLLHLLNKGDVHCQTLKCGIQLLNLVLIRYPPTNSWSAFVLIWLSSSQIQRWIPCSHCHLVPLQLRLVHLVLCVWTSSLCKTPPVLESSLPYPLQKTVYTLLLATSATPPVTNPPPVSPLRWGEQIRTFVDVSKDLSVTVRYFMMIGISQRSPSSCCERLLVPKPVGDQPSKTNTHW